MPDFSDVRDTLERATETMHKHAKEREEKTADLLQAVVDDRQEDFERLKAELTGNTDEERKRRFSFPSLSDCTVPLREGWDYSRFNFANIKFEGSASLELNFADSRFSDCKFRDLTFVRSQFHNSTFKGCEFNDSTFDECEFTACKIQSCKFLGRVQLNGGFSRASFTDLDLTDVSFGRSSGLLGPYGVTLQSVLHAERARYSLKFDCVPWTLIRTLGGLPLFGVSYVGLVSIWSLAMAARAIDQLSEWLNGQGYDVERFSDLSAIIAPPQLGFTFIALCLLALAATLYKISCPDEIQEFSETRWTLELDQPVFQYRVLASRFLIVRWVTALAYAISVPWLTYLLAFRIFETVAYFS